MMYLKTNKMKNKLVIGLTSLLFSIGAQAQNQTQGVSIASDGTPPSKDAMLDVVSATKGILAPRVNHSVIDATGVLSPINVNGTPGQDGLLVFVTAPANKYGYWYFDDQVLPNGEWKKLMSGAAGGLWTKRTDNDNIYNTGFATNKVGVGLDNPIAKFHIKVRYMQNIFLTESDRHIFGMHDYHPAIGPGSLLVHKSKFKSNLSWSQTDYLGVRRMSINTYHAAGASTTVTGELAFSNDYARVGNNGTGDMVISSNNGDVQLYAPSGTVWSNGAAVSSDSLLKTNLKVLTGSMDKLMQIVGYEYKWKDPNESQKLQYGVMAQNIQRIYPDLVSTVTKTDIVNDTIITETDRFVLNYTGLIPVMIEGMKEQQLKIEELQSKVTGLEQKYATILQRVTALERRNR